ncbi:MAG: ABC transporter permease subunit [Chloroflexi bacterium]|nr:ABC transporter permease subunit [Chloroflexota bacterium]
MDLIVQGLAGALERVARLDPDVMAAASASLAVSGTATLLSVLLGVPLGVVVGLARFRGRGLVLSLTNTGMAFPPVVVGLFVVVAIWRSGPLGGLDALCTREAMIAAQFILAFPTVLGLTAIALQGMDPMLRTQIAALGATRLQAGWLLAREAQLPLLTAAMAGFGAVISEVGASVMTGCNLKDDTRILTTAILLESNKGQFDVAFALSFILLAIVFAINAVTTWAQQRKRPL